MTKAVDLAIAEDPAIAERYSVQERIASGGFARVFRALQKATGQPVAIKLLQLESRDDDDPEDVEQIERFRRETRLCAELQHPNIVPLIDSGETQDGQLYAVFAFVPGWNLADVLAAEGALEPAEALHFMTQVIDAVSCAHIRGIVHRDLKPGNIMINASGARRNALVLDFGLGTIVAAPGARELPRLTMRGEYLGTPAYSAPEQLRGEAPTFRSDLYAWGLVLLECLTGEYPLGSTTPQQIIHRHLSPDPIPIPPALEAHELGSILRTATEKDVASREVSAEEALAALHRCALSELPSKADIARSVSAARATVTPPALSMKLSPIWAVPLGRNPNFSGRDELLRDLAESVRSGRMLAVVAVHGMGGVGKTQLALEYAYRYAERYRLVAWIRAEEPETLAADYCAIGTSLNFPDTPDERKRVALVRSWLERNGDWLLIFDNAPTPEAVRAFLPRTHTGHILVTSRESSWRALARSLPVEVLDRREATEFLLARTGESDEALAAELSEELGGLPLALEEAAAYMEATGRSISSYLPLLREHRRQVLLEPPTASRPSALRSTWELSFRQLELQAPEASDLLKLCAYLAPDDIPLDLLRAGAKHLPEPLRKRVSDEVSLDGCVAALRRYSLVHTEPDSLSIHRLVQLAARERLEEAERASWAETALRVVEEAYPRSTMTGAYQPESGRFLSHALAALSHATPFSDAELAARLLRRTGLYRGVRGMSDLALVDLERALALFESADPPDDGQIAVVLWELGMVRYALGEPAPAREHLERSLEIFESVKGPNSLWVNQILIALSWVLRTLGDQRGALSLAERSLEIAESVLGEDHETTAMSRSVMGRVLWALNRLPEARKCAERALAVLSGEQAPHPAMSGTWNNLAQIQLDLGGPKIALACVDRCLAIAERAWGEDHPFVCIGTRVRGSILLELGELDDARDLLERAVAGGQRGCRYLHEDIAIAHSELAELERRVGDLAGARAHLDRALAGTSRVCGDRTRAEYEIHVKLASVLRDSGDLDAARQEGERALAVVEAGFGREHPLCIEALELLGCILRDLGSTQEAQHHLDEARRIAEAAELPARANA